MEKKDIVRRSIFADDQESAEDIKEELRSQKLGTILHSVRCRAGLGQQEMANRLGCTQSRISKLEHSDTSRISVKDLEDYGRALGIDLVIRFQENMAEPSFETLGPEEAEETMDFLEPSPKG